MIERYALYTIDKLQDRYAAPAGVPKGVKINYNTQPTQTVPVVVYRNGEKSIERMHWGFLPKNAKDGNSVFRYKTYTVRSEDVFKKGQWESAVRTRRCLVPVNGFYAWSDRTGTKIPYYVTVNNLPVASLAGIFTSWTNAAGEEVGTVAIVTVPANAQAYALVDRLPVIVQPTQEDTWLDPRVTDMAPLYDIMRMAPHHSLTMTRIGEEVNSKKLNTPSLIHPL